MSFHMIFELNNWPSGFREDNLKDRLTLSVVRKHLLVAYALYDLNEG